jgi:hypothetical protein
MHFFLRYKLIAGRKEFRKDDQFGLHTLKARGDLVQIPLDVPEHRSKL